MNKENDSKKRKKHNQRIIYELNDKSLSWADLFRNTNNLSEQPLDVISNDEINEIAERFITLKGQDKDIYINELKQRTDAVYLAQGLIISLNNILNNYSNMNKQTMETYQKQFEILSKRLDKINETENPIEINNIYNALHDMTNKIQQLNKDNRNFLGVVVLMLTGVGAGAAKMFLKK